MKRKISLVLMVFITITTFAHASIDNLMDSIVTGVYVSKPGIYKSPSRTTASLGSMSFRLNTTGMPEPAVTFTPPRATLSCAGMDLDAGQLSMLNLSMIEDMFTNFGGQAAWGVMIGMVYSLPGFSEALGKLNEITRWAQALTQSPCELGMALGQSAGERLWGSKAKDTAENSVGSGSKSVFGEAMKEVKKNMKQKDFFQTYPYGILQKAGMTDAEIMNLFATWYGIVDIYLVNENGDKIPYTPNSTLASCGGTPCDKDNVRVVPFEPMLANMDVFVYGGKTKMYSCSGSIISGVCTGLVTVKNDENVKGLKYLIVQNIKAMRNRLVTPYGSGGGILPNEISDSVENQNNAAALYTYSAMIPNFFDVLSYSALLSKSPDSGLNDVADAMIDDMAEVMAYRLIDRFFGESQDYLMAAKSANAEMLSNATDTISTYTTNAMKSYDRIQKMMEKANEKAEFYAAAARRYQSYYDYTSQKLTINANGIKIKR